MSAEKELLALEQKTLKPVASWLSLVASLRLLAVDDPKLRTSVLSLTAPSIERQATVAAQRAYELGVADASLITKASGVTGRPSKAALVPLKGLDKAGRDAVTKAKKLAGLDAGIAAAFSLISGHAARVRGSVSDTINRSGNEGSTAVADSLGIPTVWVAETNACLDCLAYSGVIAKPGKTFPGGLTYGRKSYYPTAVEYPPRHPNCRCTVEPLNDPSYAATLRREADRSVLRGFSLENESMKARIDAADKLLKEGVTAPASVKQYARAAINEGRFATRGRPL